MRIRSFHCRILGVVLVSAVLAALAKAIDDPMMYWRDDIGSYEGSYLTLGWGVLDSSANYYLSGDTKCAVFEGCTNPGGVSCFLMRYSPQGVLLWTRLFGATTDDEQLALRMDSQSNSYVFGETQGSFDGESYAGGRDAFVTKYDANGNRQWTRIFGSSKGEDIPVRAGCVVDSNTNLYIIGETEGSFDGQTNSGVYYSDFFAIKFDRDGNKQWTRIWGSSDSESCDGDVSMDSAGNMYILGRTTGSFDGETNAGSYSPCLCRLDPSGNRLWTRIWGSSDNEDVDDIALDPATNIYVLGETDGPFDGQTHSDTNESDVFISKFNASGMRLWSRIFGSTNVDFDCGYLALDDSTNIYASGVTSASFDGQPYAGSNDPFVVKFDRDGVKKWTRIWGSAGTEDNDSCVVDRNGNAYIVGRTKGAFDGQTNSGGYDVFVTALSPSGSTLWSRIWGATGSEYVTYGLIDASTNIYVYGSTDGDFNGQTNSKADALFLTQLSATGGHSWTRIWSDNVCPYGFMISPATNIFALSYGYGYFHVAVWMNQTTNSGDGDFMNDSWEVYYFGNTVRDGSGDWDSDKITDAGEYIAGTDPTNPASVFEISGWFAVPSNVSDITWNGMNERYYTVISTTNLLSKTWSTNLYRAPGTNGIMSYMVTNSFSARFFRLLVEL